MAKKGTWIKAVLGIGSAVVAGKVIYDKYSNTKEQFVKEEEESAQEEVKKYNAIGERKTVEIQDEEFNGCELKAVCAKMVLDLSLASITKDVYINFKSQASSVVIVLPEGIHAADDVEKVASRVLNAAEAAAEEDDVPTVYVIGSATVSGIDIIPASFYGEDDDFEDFDEAETVDE